MLCALAPVWRQIRRRLQPRRCNFLFVFIGLVAPASLQARPSSTDLVLQAHQLKLSESRSWYRLNHYQKTFWRTTTSTLRGGFFLHPEGDSNPKAEMDVTLQKMFSDDIETRKETQCKYLARREFLAGALAIAENQLEICEFSSDWLRRLGAQKVSLIFASSFMNSAGSSFGHTFLKLGNPQNEGVLELTDYGINFSAKTSDTEGALYALKGLLGYFPGAFSMLPFHQMMKGYINLEGRDLWEYRLNLTPSEVQRLLYAVLELEGAYFDYYFVDDNCSFQILKLLEIAKPDLDLAEADELFVIPLDTVKRLHRTPGLILSEEPRASLQTQFRARLTELPRSSLYKIRQIDEYIPVPLADWSTPELELTQFYLALKQIDEPKTDLWRRAQDQVSRARARRAERSGFDNESLQKSLRPPENSPDSTSLGIGGFEKGLQRGVELSGRFAFHELLEGDAGAARWSELEVLSFRLRRDSDSQKAYLEEGRLLSMLSTSPVNLLFQPLSWGVRIGAFQNGEDLGHVSPLIQGQAGHSLDLLGSDLRWCLLAKGSAQETPDLQLGAGVGAETFFLTEWSSSIRAQIGIEKLFFPNWGLQVTQARGLWSLGSSFELVAEYRESLWTSQGKTAFWTEDKFLRLQYQFLY